MKKQFKYILLGILVLGCQNIEKAPKPDHLIPEDKMVNILVDLAKIDAAWNYNPGDFNDKGINPPNYIYKKYAVDSAQLAKSNAFYIEHFKINKRMYEKVRAILKKEIQKMDSLKALKDSLRTMQKIKMNVDDSLSLQKKIFPSIKN